MEALDGVLKMFYYGLCDAAKWLFAFKMATNLIKDYESSNLRDMIQDLMTGAFAYGALFSIVEILDSVKDKF